MAVFDAFDWVESLADPVRIDVRAQGDAWLQGVLARLTHTTGSTRFETNDHRPIGYLHTPSGGSLPSSMLVIHASDTELTCQVLGHGEKRTSDISPWVEAISHATANLGTVEVFHWLAIIGQDPDSPASPLALAGPATIGDMHVFPSSGPFVEMRPGHRIWGYRTGRTYPIFVRGSHHGLTASVAEQDAARDLKLVCSLLSLASGTTWVVREMPALTAEPDSPVTPLPAYSPFYPDSHKRDDNWAGPTPFEVPSWIGSAWTMLINEPEFAMLLATYHEGLLLEEANHSSYGLLASVAIIEAIGNRAPSKLPRCEECKQVTGAGARFRAALVRVVDDDLADDIRMAYSRRSGTAHAGKLHGVELFGGTFRPPALLSDDPPAEFEGMASVLRQAAARLLKEELGAPRPDNQLTRDNLPRLIAMVQTTGPVAVGVEVDNE